MPHSLKILSAVLEALADYWREQAIFAQPDKSWNPQAVALANGVTLPNDFAQLYRCSNGMDLNCEPYQTTDKEGFYFLSAEELRVEQLELVIDSISGTETITTDVIPFFDYMHCSWQYAYIHNPSGDGYRIGIMATPNSFKVITSSLATFLSLYMEDAQVLYDYSRP
jgi:hypothetical protein